MTLKGPSEDTEDVSLGLKTKARWAGGKACLLLPIPVLSVGGQAWAPGGWGAWEVWAMCLCIHSKCLRVSVKAYIVCVCLRERVCNICVHGEWTSEW